MDEVTWGPGGAGSPEDSAGRTRSAALLARIGTPRRPAIRRLSVTAAAAGFLAIAAAQLTPWAHAAFVRGDTSDTPGSSVRSVGIADGQTLLQFSYYLTVSVMLALCVATVSATRSARRVLAGAALGAAGGHLVMLLPLVRKPARLYGFSTPDDFGDGSSGTLRVIRDIGMWLGVAGTVLLAAAVGFALLVERLPAVPADPPADDPERLSDHDRPSSLYRAADESPAPEAPPLRRPFARTPSNQFAFEGHADLPVEPEAPVHPDHSMYQRPRRDTDLSAR